MVKIIKNGRVIDPESRFDGRADLWIENGKIQKIVKKDTKSESDEASDAPFIPADAEDGREAVYDEAAESARPGVFVLDKFGYCKILEPSIPLRLPAAAILRSGI